MPKEKEYAITCYVDKNYDLAGYLNLGDDCYISFDEKDIFVGTEAHKIFASWMRMLEKLILESPNVVKYDTLFQIYYDDEAESAETHDKGVIRNFVSKVNAIIGRKFVVCRSGIGYKVELPVKIRRFSNVCKENVKNIADLFPEEYAAETDTVLLSQAKAESIDFSLRFLDSGAAELLDKTGIKALAELSGLSAVFNGITEVDGRPASENTNVVTDAYNFIVNGCRNKDITEILKIRGPLGSYKNRVMQYIYLAVTKNNNDILPVYIDLASYERPTEADDCITEDELMELFEEDIEKIKAVFAGCGNSVPLLMIDGIRDFTKGNESIYFCMSKKISELNCKLVVCLDAEFTVNNQHTFPMHPLASNEFEHYMRISSMNLHKKAESIEFIKNCIGISNIKIPPDRTPEKIYRNLVRLSFSNIDAYWLVYLLKYFPQYLFDVNCDISDLYNSICMRDLGDHAKIDSAAELAYEFEFGSVDFDDEDVFFDDRWRLIRRHRSVLDYLIAKHYIRKISELDLRNRPKKQCIEDLQFFNMVLQKNITRFVVEMLKGDDDNEYRIMLIAERFYDDLSLFGKSELTFWMARLKNPARKKRCLQLLKKFNEIETARYKAANFDTPEEKKNAAFLIRGISVSLIYERDEDTLKSYMNALLNDKTANLVNRGFHLEYYGDKPYIPNKSLLDFEDDVTKGENTLNVLCLSLDSKIHNNKPATGVALVEIMTLCSLIQARIEQPESADAFDVAPYITRCIRYMGWVLEQKVIRGLAEVAQYFMWMRSELRSLSDESGEGRVSYSHARPFNKFSEAKNVVRTGWVRENIPVPENIVEHMYNCWLMGMLHLPDEYDEEGYCKGSILRMLLLHDLGETETGDISRPEKKKKQLFYDHQENMVMQSLLLSGTYPDAPDISNYLECWNEWCGKKGINYLVAKDIDDIQTIYQFCVYYLQNPGMFSAEKIEYWLSGINEIGTELGRNIADKLIISNPAFSHIIELAGDIFYE